MIQADSFFILPVSFPCHLQVIPRRYQKPQGRIVWEQGSVGIDDVEASQAPPAFRVSVPSAGPRYVIRRYRGKLWWPLFERAEPLSKERFIASAEDPAGCFLASLNMSPASLDFPQDGHGFEIDCFVGRIVEDSREDRWKLVRRAASLFLCCDGQMYAEGGFPGYFASRGNPYDGTQLNLAVGQLRPGRNFPSDVWHPALSASQKERAVAENEAFLARPIASDLERLKERHIVGASDHIEVCENAVSLDDFIRYKADTLARVILRKASNASVVGELIRQFSGLARQPSLISLSYAREILWIALHAVSADDVAFLPGVQSDSVMRMIRQIDEHFPAPPLNPDDEAALEFLSV